jgi:cytochrome c5
MKKRSNKFIIIFIFFLSGVLGLSLSIFTHYHANNNLSPSPPDASIIQTYHYPTVFVKKLIGDPQAGKKIFKEFCETCHGQPPLIDVNAPRIGDKNTWEIKRKQGIMTLLKITANGAGAMPARGGCFECSDAQLREAIKYMLVVSKL